MLQLWDLDNIKSGSWISVPINFNPTKISDFVEQLQNGKEKVVQEFERTYNVSVVIPNTISKENTQEVNDNNLKYVFCWQCFGNDLKPE